MVKRYVIEAGSSWVEDICDPKTGNVITVVQIGLVEVAAAFASKHRDNFVTQDQYERALVDLIHDAQDQYSLVGIDQRIVDPAIELTHRQKLRGYDAVQLACGCVLNRALLDEDLPPLIFASADNDLLTAARSEGLSTANPADYAVSGTLADW